MFFHFKTGSLYKGNSIYSLHCVQVDEGHFMQHTEL